MKNMTKKNVGYTSITHLLRCGLVVIVCILFTPFPATLAQEEMEPDQETHDAIDEELRWLEAETYVITPSKIPETIKKTAASITVVTDRQIRQMGAKNLHDVVWRVVPSFISYNAFPSKYFFARNVEASRILFMINGLPLYDCSSQRAGNNYSVLNMDNVKRIEFIRGPGSALYGANAYSGVINIITKKPEDVNGVEVTARGGNWDTQQYNLLFGKTFTDLEIAFNFNYLKTNGYSALIKEDFYTWYDQEVYAPLGYAPISMAPGYTREHDEKYELALNVKYKGFMFDGGYYDRQNDAPFANSGGMDYLTEKTIQDVETYHLNIGYETALGDKLDLSAKVYRQFRGPKMDYQVEPPGWIDLWGNSDTIFPEGRFFIVKNYSSRTGMELQATYKMSDANTIIAGSTYEKQKFYDDEMWGNFLWTPEEGFIRLPSIQRTMEEWDYPDQKNDFKALFLEDIWDITKDLRLTLGARYDDYGSFGGHFSPRAGLTWEYIKGYDLKLLYGHAFAVPDTIRALMSSYNGYTLDPQSMDSYELSLGAEFTPSFEMRATFFLFYEKDLITWTLGPGWRNSGEIRFRGVELEARYDFGRGSWIGGNYTYTDISGGYDPRSYLGKIMCNIRLSRYLNLYMDGILKGGLKEETWDLSFGNSDRTIVNAALIARNFLEGYEGLELRGSVYNLLDNDYAEPFFEAVPYGIPRPGIHFLFEARYKF